MNETDLIVAAGAYLGSKEILGKLLGPTADYLGGGLKSLTERGVKNLNRVFAAAVRKLGPRIEEPGAIPPRVLRAVLENGYFCDDELTTEYFGGVLASSRTTIKRDDRGTSFVHLLETLSAYQIRAHYVLYTAFRRAFGGNPANIGRVSIRDQLLLYVPQRSFNELMDFADSEDPAILTSHSLSGLINNRLLRGSTWGDPSLIEHNYHVTVPENGILLQSAARGIELFQWAHGLGSKPVASFLTDGCVYPRLLEIDFGCLDIQAFGRNAE